MAQREPFGIAADPRSAAALARVGMTRRRWLASAASVAAAAAWGGRPAAARQATPVASPVPVVRGAPGERWVATWTAAPHPPFPGFEEVPELPSQLLAFADQRRGWRGARPASASCRGRTGS